MVLILHREDSLVKIDGWMMPSCIGCATSIVTGTRDSMGGWYVIF